MVAGLPAKSMAAAPSTFDPGFSDTLQENGDCVFTSGNPLHVSAASPDSASVAVPVKDDVGVFSTAPLAGEVMDSTGGVLSSLTFRLAFALLPARSVATPAMF